jgi:hypothetical protein
MALMIRLPYWTDNLRFRKGKGYAIRAPENTSFTTPSVSTHQFVGVP